MPTKTMSCFCELQKELSSAFNCKTLCCNSSVPHGGTPTMKTVMCAKEVLELVQMFLLQLQLVRELIEKCRFSIENSLMRYPPQII